MSDQSEIGKGLGLHNHSIKEKQGKKSDFLFFSFLDYSYPLESQVKIYVFNFVKKKFDFIVIILCSLLSDGKCKKISNFYKERKTLSRS